MNLKNILFLITARGGSKGLPGKNIKNLLGKPLIVYTVESALKSKFCDKVYVSTEDVKIAEIAKKSGASVPFLRDKELATDKSTSVGVILDFIEKMKRNNFIFDTVVLLEPTSPLRDHLDIDRSLKFFKKNKCSSLVSIAESVSSNPDFLFFKNKNNTLKSINKNFTVKRRQDTKQTFFPEGSIYISDIDSLKKHKSFYHSQTKGIIFPKWKSFEIDDITDFYIIESILKNKLKFKNLQDNE